ncbi:MAG: hypothetical protein ACPGUC_02650, partial [Gammaproteobacteria bacterium]
LVVALESANKIKGDRSPAEAFGASGFTDPETGKTTPLKPDNPAALAEAAYQAAKQYDEVVLQRLVDLNAERAAEEARGHIRWLRPEFQNPSANQSEAPVGAPFQARPEPANTPTLKKPAWPKALPEQVQALKTTLAAQPAPATAEHIARQFSRARKDKVAELLDTLVHLGQIKFTHDGYSP